MVVDINVLDTANLHDFDDMAYGDADLFNLIDQLTDSGHGDIVDYLKLFTRLLCLS